MWVIKMINNGKMLIMVEGCDGVGKGFLIEKLAKKLGNSYILKNCYRPKDGSLEERKKILDIYYDIFEIFMNQRRCKYLILDRYFMSELVYCFKRNYEAKDSVELKALEGAILEKKHLLILVDRNKEEMLDVYKTRGEDFVTSDDIDIIKKRYLDFFEKSHLKKIIVTSNDLVKVLYAINSIEINEN